MGNSSLNTTEANADLQDRVRQFMTMSLPGQPMMMHMGTSYLVNDLAAEVLRLRAEARETALQYLSDTGQMSERIDELVAANAALAADNARLGKRVEEARELIHLYRKSEVNGELGMWSDIADTWLDGGK